MVIELSECNLVWNHTHDFKIERAQRDFDLKSQVWFQTKIAQPEGQLLLYWPNLPDNGFLSFIFLQCD